MSWIAGIGAVALAAAEGASTLAVVASRSWQVLAYGLGSRPSPGGVYETELGITNPQRMWWQVARWPWVEIEGFRAVGSSVYVVLRSGEASALIGAGQHHRTRWADGETRDLVGELNRRLERWRSEHAVGETGFPHASRPSAGHVVGGRRQT